MGKSKWGVRITGQAKKAPKSLQKKTFNSFLALLIQLEDGPNKSEWPHFGELKGKKGLFHCHIERGRPTYVACWRADKKNRVIEVYYVGTHEKAPY